MPRTLYLGEDEWSRRNTQIRQIRDSVDDLDNDSTAGDVIDHVLSDYVSQLKETNGGERTGDER